MTTTLNPFVSGPNNTLLVQNSNGYAYHGPWSKIYENTTLDRWYVSDFYLAEYTVHAGFDTLNKEVLKFSVIGVVDSSKIRIHSRLSTNIELIDVYSTVNESYVDVIISPKRQRIEGLDCMYQVNYYYNQTPL